MLIIYMSHVIYIVFQIPFYNFIRIEFYVFVFYLLIYPIFIFSVNSFVLCP